MTTTSTVRRVAAGVFDDHADALAAVGGDGVRTWRVVRTVGDESVEDALHRRAASAAVRGAATGAVVLGLLTAVVAAVLGADAAVAGGLALAVAFTGGPFFGALAGFATALQLHEQVRALIGPDLDRTRATLVIAWSDGQANWGRLRAR